MSGAYVQLKRLQGPDDTASGDFESYLTVMVTHAAAFLASAYQVGHSEICPLRFASLDSNFLYFCAQGLVPEGHTLGVRN